MKKQRLIALMCAGIITTSALTSCSSSTSEQLPNEKETSNNIPVNELYLNDYIGVSDAYIILEQNDIDILHKGNMGILFSDGYRSGGPSTVYNYSFNCGEQVVSNATNSISTKMPKEERYDKICEDCFGK